ncbi:MAG TPA: PQQ-binding-like beta-propeller repeat protein, partial [Gemmataceae bacterium]|nr:PQQ-binding-like beta-propeller repeat protein [Gemmataceae bacterium]
EDGDRPPRRRRSRRAWLAAGALAVLALAVLVWRPWRGRPAPPAEETVTPRPQPTTPQRQAEEALKPLAARLTEALKDGAPPEHLAELLPQLREFPRQHAGTPAAGQACRLLGRALARSPSPLDALGAAKLPDELRRRWEAAGVKPPVVAVLGEPRRRHGGAVKLLAFTPDGQTVRSVGADRVVGHWGLEKDAHRFVGLPVAPGGFWAPLAVSPDAALLAASVGANAGGGIKLWDLAAGRERVPLEDSLHAFRSGAFTPDGKVLYAIAYHTEGHSKTALWSWDVATGKKKAVYPFPIAWPDDHPFALSPDGKALALGYKASRTDTEITVAVKLWEPDTGKERSLFKGPGAQFLAVAFSPDGRTVAAKRYGDGAAILAWDAATGKELFTLPGEHPLAFSPDGKLLATGDGRLLDAASGKVRFTLPPGGVPAFAPDGKSLAYGGADGGVRLWDVATGKELRPLPGPTGPALRVALAPDGRTAAAGYRDGVRVWDVLSGRELRFRPGGRANFPALEFGPDGKTLAVAICNPQGVAFLNLATGEETRAARDPGYVYGGALSPDGKVFVTAQSGGLDLWAVADGKHQRNVSGPFAILAAFSPDGRVLAVGCHPRGARLYEAATGRPLGALENVEQAMPGVIYAPHGQALAGRDYDGKVALWDLRSKKKQHDVGTAARGPAFSPDGRLLATWGDGGVTLWDGHTGRKVREFVAPGPVHDLAFAADGRHLATANANGTVSVWRLPPEMGP